MNIKKGDILESKIGESKRKVLAVIDDVYLLSGLDDFEVTHYWYTQTEIKRLFIIPKETWVLQHEDMYWYVNSMGSITDTIFYRGTITDMEHIKFGNCFKTREEAEVALSKIKELLKSLHE